MHSWYFKELYQWYFLKPTPWMEKQIHWSKINGILVTLKFSNGNLPTKMLIVIFSRYFNRNEFDLFLLNWFYSMTTCLSKFEVLNLSMWVWIRQLLSSPSHYQGERACYRQSRHCQGIKRFCLFKSFSTFCM